ncbi:Zn-dependent alcohol dehydrogenase [Alterisphingorhabdus coralli]|uniref:Zn-dependent alcohol dehydrogenase n=1 Tax=Alterisphingorhabdus coralli TaxID=3071408 RepID=A0AA97F726_9SPHN|nr:Zn-dependent alcohol dehydrogenase [Parasphingorhabdus sp. SCSIO 66989]WOE74452.1 Zn-dependent alcohol dehydrogenase [Parasphingorhabdus sp. SCSIO 66989]
MKAALCTAPAQPLEIADITIDKPRGHEVLIRTHAVGMCHSDLKFIDGAFPFPMPFVPGHEASGVVEAVGDQVTRLKPGDHVITVLTAYCGHCESCLTGHITLCQEPTLKRDEDEEPCLHKADNTPLPHFLNLSAYAEQLLAHENSCVAINPDMPLDIAALMGCAVVTGSGAVFTDCNIEPGQSIAVIGCGGIGLAAINAASIAGAGQIIAIDPVPEKRALAESLGATHSFDSADESLVEAVITASHGGCHAVVEAVGRSQTVALAWEITRRGGITTVLGMVSPNDPVTLPGPSFLQGRTLKGSLMGSAPFPVTVPRLVNFYLQDRLKLDQLVGERLPLDQINTGLDKLRAGDGLRTLITFS